MIVKSDIPKLLLAGMKTNFMQSFEKAEKQYLEVATEIVSTKSEETYPWLGAVPKIKEWKDERTEESLNEYYFTVTNYSWEGTVSVDRDAIEDEQYGQIKLRVRELATEAKRFYDEMVFGLILQGENTTGTEGTIFENKTVACYDSKAFFATNHSEGDSGTQSNLGTATLSATDLQTAITAMVNFKDDKGKPMGIRPNVLVVAPGLEWEAKELLNSTYYPEEGATTAKLATNVLRGSLDLVISPYLTDVDAWYLFDTTHVMKPIILQMRRTPEFRDLTSGTESAFLRKKWYYGVDWRGFVAWGNWRMGYASTP